MLCAKLSDREGFRKLVSILIALADRLHLQAIEWRDMLRVHTTILAARTQELIQILVVIPLGQVS